MTTTCYTRDTHGDRTSDLPVHLARSFCSRSLVALPPCPASPITNPESTFEGHKLKTVLCTEVGGGLGEHLHPRDQAHFFRSEHLVCRKPLESTCSFSWVLLVFHRILCIKQANVLRFYPCPTGSRHLAPTPGFEDVVLGGL